MTIPFWVCAMKGRSPSKVTTLYGGANARTDEGQQSTHCGRYPHEYRKDSSRPEAAIRLCYSITSSARARIEGGTVRPSAVAVLRLTTSSKVVGCWTGRSAGLAPLRIRPV